MQKHGLQVVQTSCSWRSDSTTTFKTLNGLVLKTLLLKFIQNLFPYVEGYEVRVSQYFAEWNWRLLLECVMETKFVYCVTNSCVGFKLISLMLTWKKSFTCFFNNPNWPFNPSCGQKCILHREWKALKVLKLSSKLERKQNRPKILAMEIKKDH